MIFSRLAALRSRIEITAAGLLIALVPASAAEPGAGRMMQELRDSSDWIEQAAALQYLGDHRVQEAHDAAQRLLADEKANPWLRGRALVARVRIAGQVDAGEFGKWVAHDLAPLRAAAAEVLERYGGASAETWIEILLEDRHEMVRLQAAASHARRSGKDAWPVVEKLTRDLQNAPTRPAARALAFTGTNASHERLAILLADSALVAEALRGISDLADPALLPLLLGALREHEHDDLRFGAALTAVQNHDWQQVIASLENFLESRDERNVRTVARVMTILTRSPALGPPLQDALAEAKEFETIRAGLIALGSPAMEPDRYHELFSSHLDHEDPALRALAIRGLAHCEEINLYQALQGCLADDDPEVAVAALGALLHAPAHEAPQGRLVPYLQEPLSSPHESVRSLAYEVLGHAGSEADFRPAMAVLASLLRGNDEELRSTAAKALGALAPPEQVGEVVQAQGYLPRWMVIGTFLNDEKHSAFHTVFEPEKKIDFEETYRAEYLWIVEGRRQAEDGPIEREVQWSEAAVDETDGRLVMTSHLPPPGSLAVGYAVSDIKVDRARNVTLEVDGDDAFRVWLNGKPVAEQIAPFQSRSPCLAKESVAITLKAGKNRFLVKSANIDHHWWLRLRLTDSNGRPVAFEVL